MNSQRYDDARHAFATEFQVLPDSGPAYLLLANMLMRANLEELAADQARKALQLSPSLPLAHFLLGEVYLFKFDVDHAMEEFAAERMLNPSYAPLYDRLGDVYTRVGKLQEAQEALTKAISLDTSSTGSFIQMGKVLLRRQDPQTSIMYLKHAEKMDPGNISPANAQAVYGSIFGTITDNTGAVVPNATITVTDISKNTSVTTQTNGSGEYRVQHLIPDTYRVDAEATGFNKSTTESVVVYADTAPKVDMQLSVGAVSNTVKVTAAARRCSKPIELK